MYTKNLLTCLKLATLFALTIRALCRNASADEWNGATPDTSWMPNHVKLNSSVQQKDVINSTTKLVYSFKEKNLRL